MERIHSSHQSGRKKKKKNILKAIKEIEAAEKQNYSPATGEEMQMLREMSQQLSSKLGFDLIVPDRPQMPDPASKPLHTHRKNRHWIEWSATISIAAAIIAALFLIPQLTTHNEPIYRPSTEVLAEVTHQFHSGDKAKLVELPDGTHIYTNKSTTLSLRKGKFNAYTREIWLEEGEAFFEVAKDPSRPFIVHTPDGMSVKVLGTSFNICAYPQIEREVVSVATGKVMVSTQAQKPIYLTPNESATYQANTGELKGGNIDAQEAMAWRNGAIALHDASVDEVALRLAQIRGIELVNKNHSIANKRINAHYSAKIQTIDIARALAQVYGVQFTLKEDQLILY